MTDRIFYHFEMFFALLPPNNTENKILKKKKATRDITILYMCTINYNHMVYVSWDLEHDGLNFLSFCHFTSLTTQKIKILRKMKKKNNNNNNNNQISSFYKSVPKTMIICFMLYWFWDVACDGCNFYFWFLAIFCHFTPLRTQKIKIFNKMKKKPGDTII